MNELIKITLKVTFLMCFFYMHRLFTGPDGRQSFSPGNPEGFILMQSILLDNNKHRNVQLRRVIKIYFR